MQPHVGVFSLGYGEKSLAQAFDAHTAGHEQPSLQHPALTA